MSLTPEDIQSKQFHVRFRGFDVEEVDAFLEQAAENFLMQLEENKTLKSQFDLLTMELENLKNEESSFKDAMISAQKIAEEMKKQSREEADELLHQARLEVESLKDEALREITELEFRVDQLKGQQGQLQNDLRAVISNYLSHIDSQETVGLNNTALEDDRSNDEPVTVEQAEDHSEEGDPEEVDLSDLYEKIDLAADEPSATGQGGQDPLIDLPDLNLNEGGIGSIEIGDESVVAIPDLEDDIMFTLEDPLDQEDSERAETSDEEQDK